MMSQPTVEYAVLGGGIAGLSAAIGLKKLGIEATVFESARAFKPLGSGLTLATNAMKAFEYLGIRAAVSKQGNPVKTIVVKDQKGRAITTIEEKGGYEVEHITIHRSELHQVLCDALGDEQVVFGKQVSDISESNTGFKIEFSDGSFVLAKYVIEASGVHSVVRKKYMPDAKERYAGYTCWRGIAQGADINRQELSETWGKNGRFGIVPLTKHRAYWFAVKTAAANSPEMSAYRKEDLLKNYRDYHDPIASVIRATDERHIQLNDIIDIKPIKQYAFGNLLLIGDAAHATTPNMGQGACQAIEDAAVLVHCLKENPNVYEAFKIFEKRRLKRTHDIVKQSWQMGKMAHWKGTALTTVRNGLFRMIPSSLTQSRFERLFHFDPEMT